MTVAAPASATVPGSIAVTVTIDADAAENDVTGFIVLSRGGDQRRVPYWFRVEAPKLGRESSTLLRKPGVYRGNTAGKPSLVATYRYPELAASVAGSSVPVVLSGPEQVFRIVLAKPVANVGVAVVSQGNGVKISPRFVRDADENRLTGDVGYPVYINPYGPRFGATVPAVGAVLPATGTYDAVFDTVDAAAAGRFTFRFWVNDVTPPSVRLPTRTVSEGGRLLLAVSDAGSGVDPSSLSATVDGRSVSVRRVGTRALVPLKGVRRGSHVLRFTAADFQEAKNMEDVGPVLPNTRVLRVRFTVR